MIYQVFSHSFERPETCQMCNIFCNYLDDICKIVQNTSSCKKQYSQLDKIAYLAANNIDLSNRYIVSVQLIVKCVLDNWSAQIVVCNLLKNIVQLLRQPIKNVQQILDVEHQSRTDSFLQTKVDIIGVEEMIDNIIQSLELQNGS